MKRARYDNRHFLFLQGPHGPFFSRLGQMLRQAGASAWRVGFNRGDAFFWRDRTSFIAYRGRLEDWAARFETLLDEKSITDIVVYGDTRPVHAQAIAIARRRNVTVHVFEEGYLRPHWVTYERGGSNGHSRLMGMTVADMRRALGGPKPAITPAPGHWGDMRQHIFYGALYHAWVLWGQRSFGQVRTHRAIPVSQEFRLYLRRLLLLPWHAADRMIATRRIRSGGYPYHLVLLQLAHDANFLAHSPFATMAEFLDVVIRGFAHGAPAHHHLVFKAHPLEDGRAPLRRDIIAMAQRHGIGGRVHFVRGGKLAMLLDPARSAVTVNSTAAQQVLWRSQPLKAFGEAVYCQPEFVSDQGLPDFFRAPQPPDGSAYQDYRRFLLSTSQITGSYYSARGRRQLLRQVVDLMLAHDDPYDLLIRGDAARRQQLRAIN